MLKYFFTGGLIVFLLASCMSPRNQSGFITDLEGFSPVSDQYELPRPEIQLPNPAEATIIIFSHGTENSWKPEKCRTWYVRPPKIAMFLQGKPNTYVYFLCSDVTDTGHSDARYIFARSKEILQTVDQFLAIGVQPKNIFLMGQSAGGWSSLMAMQQVGEKFNAAIIFAPACCNKREAKEEKKRKYRKLNRRHQEREMLKAERIEALIFAYEDDEFNRPQDLTFLTEAYPTSVEMIGYHCGEGHFTYQKDCQFAANKARITEYISDRKQDFIAKQRSVPQS